MKFIQVTQASTFLTWLDAVYSRETPIMHCCFSVVEAIKTGIHGIRSLSLLNGNTTVICGVQAQISKVKSYDLQTGSELNCLIPDVHGLTEVKLCGKVALAVTRRLV